MKLLKGRTEGKFSSFRYESNSVVDDDAASATEMRTILEALGCKVQVEYDSPRALQTMLEFKPDVIFIDYLMPKAHGGDVAWQLFTQPALDENLKIILDSQLLPEEIRPKLPPRDISILRKPVSAKELKKLIGP